MSELRVLSVRRRGVWGWGVWTRDRNVVMGPVSASSGVWGEGLWARERNVLRTKLLRGENWSHNDYPFLVGSGSFVRPTHEMVVRGLMDSP